MKTSTFQISGIASSRRGILRHGRSSVLVFGFLLAGLSAMAQEKPDAAETTAIAQPTGTGSASPREIGGPQKALRISGRIVDQTGVAIAGAKIKLISEGQSASPEVQSDADGRYAFTNATPGPFQLTVTLEGFATQVIAGNLGPAENCAVPQTVLLVASVNTEVRVVPPQIEVAQEQIREQEQQRALGFIPNFYVSYVPNAAPLVPRQKFELAWKTIVDPVTFGLTAATAGIQQAQNDFSGYGQGTQGYAKRYAASYGNVVTSTLIGAAILPSVFKQDPRYFYKGTGSKRSRVLYAIAASVICKGDNGHWQANYSGLIGGLASGGISNLYYPAKNRDGAELTFENTLIGIGTSAAANILQEFVVRRFTPSAANRDPGKSSKGPNPVAKVLRAFVHEGD